MLGVTCEGLLGWDSEITRLLNADFFCATVRRVGEEVEEGDTMEERLSEIFSSYEKREDSLIPILQDVQEEYGYLPEEAMVGIAKAIGVPESRVYAVASFYAQFRFTPMGKNHVMVCRGTACHVRGASRILDEAERCLDIKEGETTEDLEYTLETVACIGCCGLAPTIVINEDTYGKLTPKDIPKIFEERKETKE